MVDSSSEQVTFAGGTVTAKVDFTRVEIPYARLGMGAGEKVLVYLLGSQANGVYGSLGEPVTLELNEVVGMTRSECTFRAFETHNPTGALDGQAGVAANHSALIRNDGLVRQVNRTRSRR